MAISVSSEFVTLCQAQIRLLVQTFGASLSVVYLTEDLSEESGSLLPVAIYPDTAMTQRLVGQLTLPLGREKEHEATVTPEIIPAQASTIQILPETFASVRPALRLGDKGEKSGCKSDDVSLEDDRICPKETDSSKVTGQSLLPYTYFEQPFDQMLHHQVVLSLQQDDFVLGFLVIGREDRDWTKQEYAQLEQSARTLALSRLLDRRLQWLQERYRQQEIDQERQQDIFDTFLHQLKNPVTALRTFGKLLKRRLQADDRNQDIVTGIVEESDRLQFLLQQMGSHWQDQPETTTLPLLLPDPTQTSQTTLPTLALPPSMALVGRSFTIEPCSFAQVLGMFLDSARAIAEERNLTLSVRLPDLTPLVLANLAALREVLSNLVDNALKYTPDGGRIVIGSVQNEYDWRFEGVVVSNTGPGIPPEDLPNLFTKHFRGIQADGTIPGTGLGLAIVKDLVEQMQGYLEVISPAQQWHPDLMFAETEGSGTGFTETNSSCAGTAFLVWLPSASPILDNGKV